MNVCNSLFDRGLIVFENKTYILEPMKNTTDSYKLVPAENMENIQGLCGSHHNHSSLTMEAVSPEPSQMWSRRVRGNLKFMLLERRAEGKGHAGLEGLEQPCCWMQCGWKDPHPSGGRGCPGKTRKSWSQTQTPASSLQV